MATTNTTTVPTTTTATSPVNSLASQSGGFGKTEDQYTLGAVKTEALTIRYDMYGIPDSLDVYLDNATVPIATTNGAVSNSGTLNIPADKLTTASVVRVIVNGEDQGTSWEYSISYPSGISHTQRIESSSGNADTTAYFLNATDLSINSVYLPFERDQTTSTPYNLFKTIDKDGSITNYHGTFVRATQTSPIAAGSKITSFEGTTAADVKQFSFSTSKGFDGLNLKNAVQANDKVAFFNIVLGGNDSLVGSSLDDVLGGYSGNDTIDGGLGNDKVFFSGNFADYEITAASATNKFITVKNTKTGETDSLINVESFQFANKIVPASTTSTPAISTNSSIVGGWYFDGGINKATLTLLADNTYFLVETSSKSMERGNYSWDSKTGSFTAIPLVDTTPNAGMSDEHFPQVVSILGDTISFTGGNIPSAPRVTSSTNPIVGSWRVLGSDENNILVTFLDNGTYFEAEDGKFEADNPTGKNGMEYGTYSWNPTNGNFTAKAIIDANGGWGLPNTASISISGNVMVNAASGTKLMRVDDQTSSDITPSPVPPVTTTGNNITITAPAASVSNTSKINANNVTTAGDDKITSSIANLMMSTIDGGAGNDTLTLSDAGNFGPYGITSIEKLQLAKGSNTVIIGTSGGDSISVVNGGAGNDVILDYRTDSSINGGAGADKITASNNSTISGGTGADVFSFFIPVPLKGLWNSVVTDFISGTDKLNLPFGIPVSTTTTPSSTSSIVGAWKTSTQFGDAIATFMSDGSYFFADSNGGAEKGTYSWDSTKSSFSVTGNTFDTSSFGFNSTNNTPTAVTFNGTSASWTVQGQKITANLITDSTKSIVGSWYAKGLGQAGGDNVFTFLSDGTYYLVNNGDPALDPSGKKGMEKGTYTLDSATGKLTTTTTVNTDGQWGFSDNVASGTTVTAKVTGSSLLVNFNGANGSGSGTLTKVVSPTTAAPTTSMVNAPVSFLGNKADLAQAQKAIVANSSKLQVVYEQDTKTLWADVNNDGALNASDLQITLNGVKTLAATDFVLN